MNIAAAVSVGLRLTAVLGGLVAGGIAVYLAMVIPRRMEVEGRARPVAWWGVAVVLAAGFGWLIADVAGWAYLPSFLVFGGATLALSLIDLDHQLIPNRLLFPALLIAGGLLAIAALLDGAASDLLRGFLAAAAYFGLLLVVAIIASGGFGMGDVKLALLLGLFLGFLGWDALGVGFVVAIMLGGLASVLILLVSRKGRKAKFAYGPYLVAGAWIGVLWGQQIADWYLGRS